jgi:hypothetical protein
MSLTAQSLRRGHQTPNVIKASAGTIIPLIKVVNQGRAESCPAAITVIEAVSHSTTPAVRKRLDVLSFMHGSYLLPS